MELDERGLMKYAMLIGAAALLAGGIVRLLRRHKPRSFRDDPIGALKDRGGMIADRAQEATEDALARLQESLDEIRGRLPEFNRKRMVKRRIVLNTRLAALNEQAQALVKDVRSTSIFSR
jgi:hypothetical protein